MIKIYQKTEGEIEKEKSEYQFYASMVKGVPRSVCPTYLITQDGSKVDTWELSEEQIMGIIEQDLQDFLSPTGTYNATGNKDLNSFDLIKATERSWKPSVDALLQTYDMEQTYGNIMSDIRGAMGGNRIVDQAETIARFQKESNGDFERVTKDEVIGVLQQMSINEKMRKAGKSR